MAGIINAGPMTTKERIAGNWHNDRLHNAREYSVSWLQGPVGKQSWKKIGIPVYN